jgi:hypothetical protein
MMVMCVVCRVDVCCLNGVLWTGELSADTCGGCSKD